MSISRVHGREGEYECTWLGPSQYSPDLQLKPASKGCVSEPSAPLHR